MAEASASPFETLHEIVAKARQNLTQNIWDYLIGGAETETTLRRNRWALDALALRPRVLRDVSRIDVGGRLLGKPLRLPVLLAPVGSLESFEAGGAKTVAEAAAAFGVAICVSSVTQPGLEETAKGAAEGRRIFQLYVRGDDDFVDDYGRRAMAAGYDAFCFTVDTALYSRRERDIAKRFAKPWRQRVPGTAFQAGLSWPQIERFRRRFDIPVILKGIATAEDAAIACELGVAAIYVSNHGGRQLDHGRGTMEFLPEIVAAVKGRAEIIVDGGFCRGTDVVKALALGATAVGLGRLYCYGLAAAGRDGVVRVLELLEDEIRIALGLCGATSFAALDPSFVAPATPVTAPGVHSAFPLLEE